MVAAATCCRGEEVRTSNAFLLRASAPSVYFLLCLVLGIAILRLQFALELLPIAIDLGELIVGELRKNKGPLAAYLK